MTVSTCSTTRSGSLIAAGTDSAVPAADATGTEVDAAGPAVRRRVLLAPVTVSPTKPLTPTHVKYLLSLDVLYRATASFADVSVLYDHASFAGSRQVAGFWAFLDSRGSDVAWQTLTEEEIGEQYVEYHKHAADLDPAALDRMTTLAESGWTHPATARLLDLWEEHYRRLGLFDPRLGRTGPPSAPAEEILDLLESRGLCIDIRAPSAPVYLDATARGLPLRVIVGPDGRANYLLYLLRQLIPQIAAHDLIVLAHDNELRTDYQVVAHVLTELGARVRRYEVPRVPIDGSVRSARHGGWSGLTVGDLAEPLAAEYGWPAFRLGARLYLVAQLGRTAHQSFSSLVLRRWTRRAARLLARPAAGPTQGQRARTADYLAALAGPRGYADPYHVATKVLAGDPAVPVSGLLDLITADEGL